MVVKKRDKKAVSVMVGYILLVVFVMGMSVVVFQWLRTYVPRDTIVCPEGVAISLNSVVFDDEEKTLEIEIVNRGNFNLQGYFIYLREESDSPYVDISESLDPDDRVSSGGGTVYISDPDDHSNPNGFKPGERIKSTFDLSDLEKNVQQGISSIRIVPTRVQKVDGRTRFASCFDSRVDQGI